MKTFNNEDYGAQLLEKECQEKIEPAILGMFYCGDKLTLAQKLSGLPDADKTKQINRFQAMYPVRCICWNHIGRTEVNFTLKTPHDIASDLIGTFRFGEKDFEVIFPLEGMPYYKYSNTSGEMTETADIDKFKEQVAETHSVLKKAQTKKNRSIFGKLFGRKKTED